MTNRCTPALEVSFHSSEEPTHHVGSLVAETMDNHSDELANKLRKIVIAGIAGILAPYIDLPPEVTEATANLLADLTTSNTNATDHALACVEFAVDVICGALCRASLQRLVALLKRCVAARLNGRQWLTVTSKAIGTSVAFVAHWWTNARTHHTTRKLQLLAVAPLMALPHGCVLTPAMLQNQYQAIRSPHIAGCVTI